MADCNKQATGKKGDERKTFMSTCLKGVARGRRHRQTHQQEQDEELQRRRQDQGTQG